MEDNFQLTRSATEQNQQNSIDNSFEKQEQALMKKYKGTVQLTWLIIGVER